MSVSPIVQAASGYLTATALGGKENMNGVSCTSKRASKTYET